MSTIGCRCKAEALPSKMPDNKHEVSIYSTSETMAEEIRLMGTNRVFEESSIIQNLMQQQMRVKQFPTKNLWFYNSVSRCTFVCQEISPIFQGCSSYQCV